MVGNAGEEENGVVGVGTGERRIGWAVDGLDCPGGRINVGGNWAVVSMGSGAARRYAVQVQSRVVCECVRARVSGPVPVGRNDRQVLEERSDGRSGQRRSRSTFAAPIAF